MIGYVAKASEICGSFLKLLLGRALAFPDQFFEPLPLVRPQFNNISLLLTFASVASNRDESESFIPYNLANADH